MQIQMQLQYKHEYRYKLVAGMAVVVVGINIVKVEDRALLRPLKWKIQRPAALPAPDSSDHTIPYSNRSPTLQQLRPRHEPRPRPPTTS